METKVNTIMDPDENPDRLAVHGVTMDESHTETMEDGTVVVKTTYTKTTKDNLHADVFGSEISKSPSIKKRMPSFTGGETSGGTESHMTTYEIKVNAPEPKYEEISREFSLESQSIPQSGTIWKTERITRQEGTGKSVETSISDSLVVDSPILLQSKPELEKDSESQHSVSRELDISEYLIAGGPSLLASEPPVKPEQDRQLESEVKHSVSKDFNMSEYLITDGPTLLASEPPIQPEQSISVSASKDFTGSEYLIEGGPTLLASEPPLKTDTTDSSEDFLKQSSVLLAHHSPVPHSDSTDKSIKQTVVTVDEQKNMELYAWLDDEIKFEKVTTVKSKPKSRKPKVQLEENVMPIGQDIPYSEMGLEANAASLVQRVKKQKKKVNRIDKTVVMSGEPEGVDKYTWDMEDIENLGLSNVKSPASPKLSDVNTQAEVKDNEDTITDSDVTLTEQDHEMDNNTVAPEINTVLKDNAPSVRYYVFVYTGSKWGAGTGIVILFFVVC